MRASVLAAQAIFAILGVFFTVGGIIGQMSYRSTIWSTGPQPIAFAFIGLPLIGITLVLTVLHKRNHTEKNMQISVRCLKCGHLNRETTKFCGECGSSLNPMKHRDENEIR
jgi:hypothetical protein